MKALKNPLTAKQREKNGERTVEQKIQIFRKNKIKDERTKAAKRRK